MVRNVTGADLILLDLLAGQSTDAAAAAIDGLRARGMVEVSGGKARLTGKGRRRAERLSACAPDMRAMFAPGLKTGGDNYPLRTDAAAALRG